MNTKNQTQHVRQYVEKAEYQKQSNEDWTNTKKQDGAETRNYPQWLDDLFALFLINYDAMWADTMPDERAVLLKKAVWYEGLKQFKPETIARAGREIMLRCTVYPPRIGEMHKLCEEFSKVNRYNEFQLENKQTNAKTEQKEKPHEPRFKYTANNPQPPPSPLLAQYMAENHIDKQMPVEDAKAWFYALRDGLKAKTSKVS